MAKERIAGIYLIRVRPTRKIYIGESLDIHHRWKRYIWAAKSHGTYKETSREIVKAIQKYGEQQCEFTILECGKNYEDESYRLMREIALIAKYNSADLKVGYNKTTGGERGPTKGRVQSVSEKMRRCKPVVEYDTVTGRATLHFSGAKAVGKKYGFSKDVMSHTVKRGSLFLDRYYLIPLSKSEQNDILEKLRKKKLGNVDQPQKARSHSANAFYKYEEAVKRVNEIFDE